MSDLEIPIGKRTVAYRFFEMVPAIISYGSILLLIILSIVSPFAAAAYLLAIIITALVKAVGIAYHTTTGRDHLEKAQNVDWHERLKQLENPKASLQSLSETSRDFHYMQHLDNLRHISDDTTVFPSPSQIYNAVIIATYNESYDILRPTIDSLLDTTYDKDHLIVVIAYEERGGDAIRNTVHRLEKEFKGKFKAFLTVEHPSDLPNEVRGKGGNITFAGFFLKQWLRDNTIEYSDVIVTTLDADNRTHSTYFDYLTYEYIVHPDRKHLSYQPVCLFTNNIWDVPAPMRVVATGNSFWNIISSMRPHTLRNFASHSQSMDALVEMDFWSTRTIVEDGHQYWRSYFHFKGKYSVVPILVPIYQDAVLSSSYKKTLIAQFIQLRRWAYGASDVPYVATRIFSRRREVPLGAGLARLVRLIDGHVTLASIAVLIAVGGWVPLFVNGQAAHSIAAHQLPEVISTIQRFAMIGLLITIFFSFKLLPPRPERYKRRRNVWMVLQWFLMPFTAVIYSSLSAFTSQTALLLGRYFDKFDVTEKATIKSKVKK
ncbi:glycosyltransferase family 2 protein [Candidatus Saccharibacteria bacterium]|nr:glycosyltransferase family 2 protein [Candidatus Saccharibacteria bacterium]